MFLTNRTQKKWYVLFNNGYLPTGWLMKQLHGAMTVNGGPIFFSDRVSSALGTPPEDYPPSRGVHLHMVFENLEKANE